jgi:organic hydroperoxide reductase OsmC/OhrA
MSEHRATIKWKAQPDADYARGRFTREHSWTFDGGLTVQASASPAVVPPPMSNPAYVDPEEAFVASLSSCHMLTFVYVAWRKGFVVSSYEDDAVGTMTKNAAGTPWISTVVLRPKVVYGGEKRPTPEEEHELHEAAHDGCFIAQSVKTDVKVEPAG